MITGHPLEKIINGPAHHTLHHIYFTVNYGQVCIHLFMMLFRVVSIYCKPRAQAFNLLFIFIALSAANVQHLVFHMGRPHWQFISTT